MTDAYKVCVQSQVVVVPEHMNECTKRRTTESGFLSPKYTKFERNLKLGSAFFSIRFLPT